MPIVKEGKAVISAPAGEIKKSDLVFYNPEMVFNRDISVLVLQVFAEEKQKLKQPIRVADAMAASGVRPIRYALEIPGLDEVLANDINPTAIKLMQKNARANKVKLTISREDANIFLSKQRGTVDFVDIDPFGSPAPFMDSSIRTSTARSMIALTATDTAPLCGTYPKKCMARYGSKPMRNDLQKEVGLRILVKEAILAAARHEKAFVPVLCFEHKHYFRVFGYCLRSKSKMKEQISKLGYVVYDTKTKKRKFAKVPDSKNEYAGLLYAGNLFDTSFIEKMIAICSDEKLTKFLDVLLQESKVGGLVYNLHDYYSKKKTKAPKTKELLEKLHQKKIKASACHYGGMFVRAEKLL